MNPSMEIRIGLLYAKGNCFQCQLCPLNLGEIPIICQIFDAEYLDSVVNTCSHINFLLGFTYPTALHGLEF